MPISIQFWKSSDGEFDAEAEFKQACVDFPDKKGYFEKLLETLARQAAQGRLTAGTFLLRDVLYEALKKTALPEEVREIVDEFDSQLKGDRTELRARIDVAAKSWSRSWQAWKSEPVRRKLKQALRMILTFRPPKETYVAHVPFTSHGFNYELIAHFDVERTGMRSVVVFWRIEA